VGVGVFDYCYASGGIVSKTFCGGIDMPHSLQRSKQVVYFLGKELSEN